MKKHLRFKIEPYSTFRVAVYELVAADVPVKHYEIEVQTNKENPSKWRKVDGWSAATYSDAIISACDFVSEYIAKPKIER